MGFLEGRYTKPNLITVSYDKLMNAARSRSFWYLTFGVACCAIEFMAAAASHYDFERYGMFFRASPRQVDMIIISGTITRKYAPVVKRLYEQMAEPKYVLQWVPAPLRADLFTIHTVWFRESTKSYR